MSSPCRCRWASCPGRSWKHTWSSGSAGPPALGDSVAAMDTFVVMAREQTIGIMWRRIRGSVGARRPYLVRMKLRTVGRNSAASP